MIWVEPGDGGSLGALSDCFKREGGRARPLAEFMEGWARAGG